ncbi:MAG: type II secretion system F family protein [Candidatus Omnitrophica bacterium]|nr:type II secretion system F family protein [Candidatus Omnitrophota bacterium]MCB9722022.1 type II secretion system F family protein [Candidatus Omnitrophota bacterium]
MNTFNYRAKQGPRNIVHGTIEAENKEMAIRKVIQSGYTPIAVSLAVASAKPKKKAGQRSRVAAVAVGGVRPRDIVVFTRQLSDLVDASVPILRAMAIIRRQTDRPALKELYQRIYSALENGSSLSEALRVHRKLFSNFYVELVRTGEASGQLAMILDRLANYLEKEQEVQGRVLSSLAYPFLILLVGIATVFVLLTWVIPRITVMFEDLGQELPAVTMVLIGMSEFFAGYWWVLLAAVIGLIAGGTAYAGTPQGAAAIDEFKLRVPLLGSFIRMVELGRVSRTLGTLIESSLDITSALNSASSTVQNSILREEFGHVPREVSQGAAVHTALKKCSFFSEMAINIITVGEETGNLGKGFNKVAHTSERLADDIMKTLVSLIGPLVLMIIVGIVGFMVVAMLLPIFQMNLLIS